MNSNSMAIAILCSHLCVGEGIKPLEPKEWGALAQRMYAADIQPSDILTYDIKQLCDVFQMNELQAERIMRLLDRSGSLSFELSKYENMGIQVLTRADEEYSIILKKKLGNSCPPLFYAAGNLELLKHESIGYVGSRTISDGDMAVTREFVRRTAGRGYAVVSGGAKGVDQIAQEEALDLGGCAISYVADSMLRKIKNSKTVYAIQQGKLLMLSVVNPDAGFNAGIAMMRNKYVYAQSSGTVVIKSDYNKGGTWTGAMENLKNNWCPTFCWNHSAYKGNKELIGSGAIPIDQDWNGDITGQISNAVKVECEQISMFDSL